MEFMILVEQLLKSYGTLFAVNNLNLCVERGIVFGLKTAQKKVRS